jgi:hypothetical protein
MAKTAIPIMSTDQEKFLAFEGLVQWAFDVVEQSRQISKAIEQQRAHSSPPIRQDPVETRRDFHALHSACHHFVIAAHKLLEHRDWVITHGLCIGVDFSEIDQFSKDAIRDLRNMREHVKDYFQGLGNAPGRWVIETPQFRADASSLVGPMIGGRLDWIKFASATERLIPILLALPIPYPKR